LIWVPKAIKPAFHFVVCYSNVILSNRIQIISITNFSLFNWSV